LQLLGERRQPDNEPENRRTRDQQIQILEAVAESLVQRQALQMEDIEGVGLIALENVVSSAIFREMNAVWAEYIRRMANAAEEGVMTPQQVASAAEKFEKCMTSRHEIYMTLCTRKHMMYQNLNLLTT